MFPELRRAVAAMAAVFFAGALGTLFYNRIIAIIGQKVLKEIRDDLFVKMQTFPIRFFDTHTHGDIMSVYTNDTDTLRQFIAQSLPMMISSLVTIVFAFCFMLRFHMVLTGIVAVLSAGMVTAARAMIRRSGTYFARQQDSTGAGKTTITNLINRFYDLADGKIRYDGINITKIRKTDLRRSMGMILQDVNLFTGTVMDNIRYGRLDATDEECIRAAKLSGADSFITRLPEGYQTVISGDNNNLSQGQCQLISIARAAVADPPVMIMDEAPPPSTPAPRPLYRTVWTHSWTAGRSLSSPTGFPRSAIPRPSWYWSRAGLSREAATSSSLLRRGRIISSIPGHLSWSNLAFFCVPCYDKSIKNSQISCFLALGP